jgi:hypothetical protein
MAPSSHRAAGGVWVCEYVGVWGQVLAGQGQRKAGQGQREAGAAGGRAGAAGGVWPRTAYRQAPEQWQRACRGGGERD